MTDPLETADTDQPGFEAHEPSFREEAGRIGRGLSYFARAAGRNLSRSFDRRMEPVRRGARAVRDFGARGVQAVRNFGAGSARAVRNFGTRGLRAAADRLWAWGDSLNDGAGPQRRSREESVEDRSGDRSNTGAEEQRKLRKDRTGAKRGRDGPLADRPGVVEERDSRSQPREPSVEERRRAHRESSQERRDRELRERGEEFRRMFGTNEGKANDSQAM